MRFVHVGYRDGEDEEMAKEIASLVGDTLAVGPQQEMRPDDGSPRRRSRARTNRRRRSAT